MISRKSPSWASCRASVKANTASLSRNFHHLQLRTSISTLLITRYCYLNAAYSFPLYSRLHSSELYVCAFSRRRKHWDKLPAGKAESRSPSVEQSPEPEEQVQSGFLARCCYLAIATRLLQTLHLHGSTPAHSLRNRYSPGRLHLESI